MPWHTLTELLANYQRGDLGAVNALYDADSLAYIEQALADPDRKQKYLEMMNKVAGMDVLLGFQHKGGFLAMVNVHFNLGEEGVHTEIQPVFFMKSGSQYQVSRVVLDEAIDKNISIYLKDHSVQGLTELTVYTLTVQKSGIGSGTVVSSGIDCGQTCT